MSGHPWRALRTLSHVDVVWRPMRGLLGRTDGNVITLHPQQSQAQRRCTLQHELVHLARGTEHGADPGEEETVERTAACILIPMPLLLDRLRWTRDHAELADECWVDEPMLLARLRAMSVGERRMVAALAEEIEGGC